jgi:hypothetical protein
MWQHLLVGSANQEGGLFDAGKTDDPVLGFEQLPVIELARAVPESSWNRTDPRAKEMESSDLFEEGLSG